MILEERGRALGMVMTLPESDSYSFSREKALARLAMLFGGREAEIKKFGPVKVTSGASGDIQMATGLARSMVMEWGMSERLGRVRYKHSRRSRVGRVIWQSPRPGAVKSMSWRVTLLIGRR